MELESLKTLLLSEFLIWPHLVALFNNLNPFGCNWFNKLTLEAVQTTCPLLEQDGAGTGNYNMGMGFRPLAAGCPSHSQAPVWLWCLQATWTKDLACVKGGSCHVVKRVNMNDLIKVCFSDHDSANIYWARSMCRWHSQQLPRHRERINTAWRWN